MPPRIKSISIKAFRGIRELQINLDGKGLVIQGENGTGKSSIAEALEFFFTGHISHLEGTQGLSEQHHAPHVHFGPADVDVTLAFDPGNVRLTRTFTSEPVPPPALAGYYTSARTHAFILRRSQLLSFIASRPADRFRALASIIGVDPLDEIELEMMRARDDLQGELEAKTSQILTLFEALSADLGLEVSAIEQVLPELNAQLEASGLPLLDSLSNMDEHAESMLKSVKSASGVEASAALNVILGQARSHQLPNNLESDLAEFNERAKALHDEGAAGAVRLMGLLATSRRVIEEEALERCPVCLTPIQRDDLLAHLTQRMLNVQALTQEAAEVRVLAARTRTELGDLHYRSQAVSSSVPAEFRHAIPSIDALVAARLFTDGIPRLAASADLEVPVPLDGLADQLDELKRLWESIPAEIEGVIANLGVTEEEKRLLESIRLVASVKTKVAALSTERNAQVGQESMLNTARLICDSFSASKRDKVAEIYERIQDDIGRYYSQLHPGEPHAQISLRLSSARRASTELRISSFGRPDEDPRALCSEGHLDSLGLCIFLAFVQRFGDECTLIVLDDVITAIDASHRRKVCDLLFEEFRDHQLVITTHDAIWYQELEAAERAYALGGAFLNLQILGWDVDSGPTIDAFMPQVDRIRRRLEAGDKESAGSECRQYLEWLLKQMALNTNTPVPVNDWRRPTVGSLQPHVRRRIVSLVSDKAFADQLQNAFNHLEKTVIFGNLFSHDNILADQVSLAEVGEFFEAAGAIHRMVACADCGSLLTYVREARQLCCSARRCASPTRVPTN